MLLKMSNPFTNKVITIKQLQYTELKRDKNNRMHFCRVAVSAREYLKTCHEQVKYKMPSASQKNRLNVKVL